MADQPRKSWLGRNWFWVVPVGCLGMLAVAVGFIALILVAAFSLMKSSDAYEQGVAKPRQVLRSKPLSARRSKRACWLPATSA